MSKRHSKPNSNRSSHHSRQSSNQSNKNAKKHSTGGGSGPGLKAAHPDTSNFNGVYLNKSMSHALTALVGTKVVVRVRNEDNVYEGFFHCFSQNMDLVVSGVHKVKSISAWILEFPFIDSNWTSGEQSGRWSHSKRYNRWNDISICWGGHFLLWQYRFDLCRWR